MIKKGIGQGKDLDGEVEESFGQVHANSGIINIIKFFFQAE